MDVNPSLLVEVYEVLIASFFFNDTLETQARDTGATYSLSFVYISSKFGELMITIHNVLQNDPCQQNTLDIVPISRLSS